MRNDAVIEIGINHATKQIYKADTIEGKVTALERASEENLSRVIRYIVAALCSAGVDSFITYYKNEGGENHAESTF